MDGTLKAVVGLVTAADVEARCAAVLVLTHLKADDDRVIRIVGDTLRAKNAVVRDFAVGYFEHVRPREGLSYLVPLLDSEEDGLRERVGSILASYGQAAVAAVKKVMRDAPRRRLNAIIALCARVHTPTALDLLFDLISGEDFDSNRSACDAVIAAASAMDSRGHADLFARAQTLATASQGRRTALVAAAKLFGVVSDPKARRHLFPMLTKDQPQAVRTHALAALVQCLRGQKLTPSEVQVLVPLLDEDDEPGVLRPTIHLLEDHPFDRSGLPQLHRLAESPQPLVKRFAVQKLGGFESGAEVKTLIGYLTDDSYARRDQATASLKKLPAARQALMKEFLACDDERKAWTVADILLVHDRNWKRDTLDGLWQRLEQALERRDDRLYTAYFHFLNVLDPAALAERVEARAVRARKRNDFTTTAKWLSLLKDSPAFGADVQFALAVAELKSHRHALAPAVRRHDPALEILRGLAHSTYPTADRLRKERVLSPEELFYVAFNFSEGDPEDRTTARELLQHLSGKFGRTKVGKAAKNKLRLLPAA